MFTVHYQICEFDTHIIQELDWIGSTCRKGEILRQSLNVNRPFFTVTDSDSFPRDGPTVGMTGPRILTMIIV